MTRDNYRELLTPLLTEGGGQGFCVNLSVDTCSTDIMELCSELGALYIDTVVEPWLGFYFDKNIGPGSALELRPARSDAGRQEGKPPGSTTAVSSCGANPGMVSWFVKQALLDVAATRSSNVNKPKSHEAMGQLDAASSASRASTSPNATPSAPRSRKSRERLRQHLVGGRFPFGRRAAGRTRLGHA